MKQLGWWSCFGNLLELKGVGLALNVSKTKNLTTQTQPGKTVTTQDGLEMEVLDATKAQGARYQDGTLATEKLTGTSDCMLPPGPSMRTNGSIPLILW